MGSLGNLIDQINNIINKKNELSTINYFCENKDKIMEQADLNELRNKPDLDIFNNIKIEPDGLNLSKIYDGLNNFHFKLINNNNDNNNQFNNMANNRIKNRIINNRNQLAYNNNNNNQMMLNNNYMNQRQVMQNKIRKKKINNNMQQYQNINTLNQMNVNDFNSNDYNNNMGDNNFY